MRSFAIVSVSLLIALGAACTDEGEGDNASGGSTASSLGGSTPAAGGSGAMSSNGGAGGGSGGNGGNGGSGPLTCLDAGVASQFFTLAADDLCIVEKLDAAGLGLPAYGTTPTWGAHGGPLTFSAAADNTSLTITRWSRAGASLTAANQQVALAGVPADAFFGPIAIESAAADGNACAGDRIVSVGWTGADFFNQGAVVTVTPEGDAVGKTATGVFGIAAVGTNVYYTGLSELGGPTNGVVGLYAGSSDACGLGLSTAGAIETGWGLATGPVIADRDGNLFAILTDYLTGRQLIHGYRAADLSSGGPIDGAELFDLEGYGDAFAAVAPSGGEPGLLVLQPNAGVDSFNQDVLALEYGSAGGTLTSGLTKTLLTLTSPDQNLTLMTDDEGRLWVGASVTEGNTTTATFFVLARPPAN